MSKPNIVLFFTDDQRFDTIAALGNPDIRTPNIDRLVARGLTMTHAHIPGGTSGAICMPSRAMLHTGRTLFHLQGAGGQVPDDHTLLGEHLRAQGYRTFGTGKWHNGRRAFWRSFTDGAEIFFGGMTDHWNVPAYDFDPTGAYDGTCPRCPTPLTSKEEEHRNCDHIIGGKHSSELLTDAAVSWLRDYDDSAPFFMYVAYLAPHDPRVMPQSFRDMYSDADIELSPNHMAQHPFDIGVHQIRDEVLAAYPRQEAQVREHVADYYAMITHLDAELGRLLDALDEKGVADDTVIVFAGDNGLAVGRHGLFGKQNLYEHSVRVPLILSGPGVPSGERSNAFCYLLDIFPTLCDLADVAVPESVEGKTLSPVLADPSAAHREDLFMAYTELHRGVRTRRHKLIEYHVRGEKTTQLFDLQEDPHELNNRARDPELAETVAALRTRLAEMSDAWDDRDTQWGQDFWG